jgi:hypothetical protein
MGDTLMGLTFYYPPMSTAVITAMVLEELGVPCEKIRLDWKAGDTRRPEFLRLNPIGKLSRDRPRRRSHLGVGRHHDVPRGSLAPPLVDADEALV